jgi:hypothetical protein
MSKHNQDGAISATGISLVIAIVLLITAAVFGVLTFSSEQKYKNNDNQLISAAVTTEHTKDTTAQQVAIAQAVKQPYNTYQGTEQYGNISFEYPRTWSAYNALNGVAGGPINGYFMPGILTSVSDGMAQFSLRVDVLSQPYAQVVQGFTNQTSLTSKAYTLPLEPNSVGVEINGVVSGLGATPVTMVVLPDRTNTIEIWTVGTNYLSDFNSVILPNFNFSP